MYYKFCCTIKINDAFAHGRPSNANIRRGNFSRRKVDLHAYRRSSKGLIPEGSRPSIYTCWVNSQ